MANRDPDNYRPARHGGAMACPGCNGWVPRPYGEGRDGCPYCDGTGYAIRIRDDDDSDGDD